MNKLIRFFIVAICMSASLNVFSQEEFFGHQDGLSLGGTTNFYKEVFGADVGLHFKR